ncbi:MAG: M48 family metalloprotease [Candidatus Aenigmarchaeota archaeon]
MIHIIGLFGVLTAILLAVGWFFGGLWGMGMFLAIAASINFFSYWYSDRIILRLYKAKPANNGVLEGIAKELAHNSKIPTPKVYVMPSGIPNAFATGRDHHHAAIAVTKGLLEFPEDEIRAVMAHEIGHIRNRDVLVSTLAATIGGAVSYIAQIGYWSLFMGGGRKGEGGLIGLIFVIIFAPLAALFVRMAINRSREYRADFFGAVMTKNPKALASALRRISEVTGSNPIKGVNATSHMWIVNPFKQDLFTGLFSTHPPLQKRIERLETMDASI